MKIAMNQQEKNKISSFSPIFNATGDTSNLQLLKTDKELTWQLHSHLVVDEEIKIKKENA